MITSHELARRLLALPDLPMIIGDSTPHMGSEILREKLVFNMETVAAESGEITDETKMITILFIDIEPLDIVPHGT